MRGVAIVVGALLAAGCFGPRATASCGLTCGAGDVCPSGAPCSPNGFCDDPAAACGAIVDADPVLDGLALSSDGGGRCPAGSRPGPLATDFASIPPWTLPYETPTAAVTANGRLTITLRPTDASSYGGFSSDLADFTRRRVFIEIVAAPPLAVTAQLGLGFTRGGDTYHLWVEDGLVRARNGGSELLDVEDAFDPVAHRFLGFATTTTTLQVEGSPDGMTWDVLASAAVPSWLTSAQLDVYAGTYRRVDNTVVIQLEGLDDCVE